MLTKIIILVIAILSLGSCAFQEAPYAEWAHSHVVWINGRQQKQADVISMVDEYLASIFEVIVREHNSWWGSHRLSLVNRLQ